VLCEEVLHLIVQARLAVHIGCAYDFPAGEAATDLVDIRPMRLHEFPRGFAAGRILHNRRDQTQRVLATDRWGNRIFQRALEQFRIAELRKRLEVQIVTLQARAIALQFRYQLVIQRRIAVLRSQ